MAVFKVPIRVSVAPVQTYAKTIKVEAASPQEAADIIRSYVDSTNTVLSDAINSPGWKPVGGRMGPVRPDLTVYETYLDEEGLDEWAALPAAPGAGG